MKWLDNFIMERAARVVQRQQREKDNREDRSLVPQTLSINGRGLNMIGQSGTQKLQRADLNRDNKSLNFTLHPAEGGYILELNNYDANHDRYNQRLHIINDGDDMGDAIAKILTLELLRR